MSNPSNNALAVQTFFTPITPPILHSLGRKPIYTFLQDRELHLQKVEEAKASGQTVSAIGLKSCINRDLLLPLVEDETLKGIEKVDDLQETTLQQHLEEINAKDTPPLSAEDLELQVKKTVKMKASEPDPSLRIAQLIMEHRTFLRLRKMSDLIKNKPKKAIKHVVSALQPAEFKC